MFKRRGWEPKGGSCSMMTSDREERGEAMLGHAKRPKTSPWGTRRVLSLRNSVRLVGVVPLREAQPIPSDINHTNAICTYFASTHMHATTSHTTLSGHSWSSSSLRIISLSDSDLLPFDGFVRGPTIFKLFLLFKQLYFNSYPFFQFALFFKVFRQTFVSLSEFKGFSLQSEKYFNNVFHCLEK